MSPEHSFRITPNGPYSLEASRAFLEGFGPAAYPAGHKSTTFNLAFVAEGSDEVAGVALSQTGTDIIGEMSGGASGSIVEQQIRRILSLDIDGGQFGDVGRRDPVIGALQKRYVGLRPVCFFSPYEAAAWALISQRLRIMQAARIKARIAEELGPSVQIQGETWHAFPAPGRLLALEDRPDLIGRKAEWLRGLAAATLDGKLDAEMLRSMEPEAALEALKELPGIGPFSAELILIRGAGAPDVLPSAEPRLARAFMLAYGLDHTPSQAEIAKRAELWRPYRSWACVLLRVMLEAETGEITGRARQS